MRQYLNLMKKVLNFGDYREDRTGVGTYAIFGEQMRFDMSDGFPLLTTKKLHIKSIIHELLWFISGDTNVKYLNDNGVTIWNEWVDGHGNLGPVYGKQWRAWKVPFNLKLTNYEYDTEFKVDQLQQAINAIMNNPYSRRILVSAWNVGELELMALPPCHMMYQFFVRENKYLDLQMYQRSVDVFLGLPYNIASYSFLLHMVAYLTDLMPGEFIWTGGDIHLYSNHIKQAKKQLKRKPKKLPELTFDRFGIKTINDFKYEDFIIEGYNPDPHIKAEIAV